MNKLNIAIFMSTKTKQVVQLIRNVAENKAKSGEQEVADQLLKLAEGIENINNQAEKINSSVEPSDKPAVMVRIYKALQVVETTVDLVNSIPLNDDKILKAIANGALNTFLDVLRGDNPNKEDEDALNRLLSITNLPDIKANAKEAIGFLSNLFKKFG